MSQNRHIEHKGIVTEVTGTTVLVNILAESACAACHAKGACTVSDVQDKTIEINSNDVSYKIGEHVVVELDESLGFKALFIGYLLPFLLVLISLIILVNILKNQGLAGLISISLLIPYFIALTFFKDKLKKTFTFRIRKINLS